MDNTGKWYNPYFDILLLPFVFMAGLVLKVFKWAGVQNLPKCKIALFDLGIYPLTTSYYEPQFDMRHLEHSLARERYLPGIDWNEQEQLDMLEELIFTQEINGEYLSIPAEKSDVPHPDFQTVWFESGDAEYWYQLVRLKKPRNIIEIGSGYSTLIAQSALNKNMEEEPEHQCNLVCIEPYENPWLEEAGIKVLRKNVEDIELSFFEKLGSNDILFIDSSHMIRPEGDVLFEYLQLLPSLNVGVIVHVHDIFSPRNYLRDWLVSKVRFWNEQYLLEAFLTDNKNWKIIGALNHLKHAHYEKLRPVCPNLRPDSEPGSFYIQKTA